MGIQEIQMERLMPVTEHDGYFITESGKVFCARPINGKGSRQCQLRPVKLLCSSGGYLQFGADRYKVSVHKAVATAFIGPCPEGLEVAHRDGNKSNNHVSNLEYASHTENEKMKHMHGTDPSGSRNGASKLTWAQVVDIKHRVRNGKRGTARRVALEYGISESTVSMLLSGKRWRAGGES